MSFGRVFRTEENPAAAANLIFALSLMARIEGCFFIGTAVGCLYALTLPLFARHGSSFLLVLRVYFVVTFVRFSHVLTLGPALLLPFAVIATLCACVDGNSADILPFGRNALVVTPQSTNPYFQFFVHFKPSSGFTDGREEPA